jgi:hypothetical protein
MVPGDLPVIMKHYLGISLVLVTVAAIGFLALRACTATVDQTVDHVAQAFSDVLHVRPQVTVNERVVLSQTAPIAELAVVTKTELVSIGLDSHLEVLSFQIPLTEKKLTAEATFRLKAGFDLREPFTVALDPATHALKAAMPHAKILSVEQVDAVAFHGDDALLNRVTDDERAQILKNLIAAAHDAAEQSGLKLEAEQQVAQRLTDLMQRNGQSLGIEWTSAPSLSPAP